MPRSSPRTLRRRGPLGGKKPAGLVPAHVGGEVEDGDVRLEPRSSLRPRLRSEAVNLELDPGNLEGWPVEVVLDGGGTSHVGVGFARLAEL